MLVAVVAPQSKGNGNTVTAMLLALGLGNKNKRVILTQTNEKSEVFYKYLGLEQYEDKTSTPAQMVKLLQDGAIPANEIVDYCKEIADGVYVFTNNQDKFTSEAMYSFIDIVTDINAVDYTICDINDVETETAQKVLKKADLIVVTVTQSVMELDAFRQQKKQFTRLCNGTPLLIVCNKFSSVAGKEKEIGFMLGEKVQCPIIHYNPWVVNACNTGRVVKLYKTIKTKVASLVELDKDIVRLATTVAKIKIVCQRNKRGQ